MVTKKKSAIAYSFITDVINALAKSEADRWDLYSFSIFSTFTGTSAVEVGCCRAGISEEVPAP